MGTSHSKIIKAHLRNAKDKERILSVLRNSALGYLLAAALTGALKIILASLCRGKAIGNVSSKGGGLQW